MSTLQRFLRRKPVELMLAEGAEGESRLRRSISLLQLTSFGIGATIGTGIFFVLKETVPHAGPAVIVSFVIAGIVAGLSAICYAELAGAVPVSGSSYSYAYATMGEGVAMIVAACLLLEYGVSCAAIAVGWAEYLNKFLLNVLGLELPVAISQSWEASRLDDSTPGGIINLPAVCLVLLCMVLLLRGVSESAKVNAAMVVIKVGILVLFVVVAATGWNTANLTDFAPHGTAPIMTAAGTIFFSYIGLDAVSTAGEEVRNPRRNLPLAILIALSVVTTLYIVVAVVGVAAQPWQKFEGQKAGLAQILQDVTGQSWPATVLSIGAVLSIFSITLVILYGQVRILYAMSKDGMIPRAFSRVDPRTKTPALNTIVVAVVVAALAGFLPLVDLMNLTSIGTLVAFFIVSVGVVVLRYRQPHLHRTFRVPFFPVLPALSALGCLWVFSTLVMPSWGVFAWKMIIGFGVWVLAALAWYFFYGMRHSRLNQYRASESAPLHSP